MPGFKIRARVVTVFPGDTPTQPKCTLLKDALHRGHVVIGIDHAIAPDKGSHVLLEYLGDGAPPNAQWRIVELAPEEVPT